MRPRGGRRQVPLPRASVRRSGSASDIPEPRQLRRGCRPRLLFGDRPVALLQRSAKFHAQFERGCAGGKPRLQTGGSPVMQASHRRVRGADLGVQLCSAPPRLSFVRPATLQAGAPLGHGQRQVRISATRSAWAAEAPWLRSCSCSASRMRSPSARPDGTMRCPGRLRAPQFANGRVVHDAALPQWRARRASSPAAFAFVGNPVAEAQAPLRLGVFLGPPRFHAGGAGSGKRGPDRRSCRRKGLQFIQRSHMGGIDPVDLPCR